MRHYVTVKTQILIISNSDSVEQLHGINGVKSHRHNRKYRIGYRYFALCVLRFLVVVISASDWLERPVFK